MAIDWILDGAVDIDAVEEITDDVLDEQGNRLQAVVICPRCSQEVELWAPREDDGTFDPAAHGECCNLVFVDWWEGTVFFEEPRPRPIETVTDRRARI
jgi:hypothetical protein